MNTSPESSWQPTNGQSSPNGTPPHEVVFRTERRSRPQPNNPDDYLRALPASVLLDRLPVPMLATGLDGIVVYNNPAFSTMLGHGPDVTLAGFGLPALLDGHSARRPADCVTTLRAANNVLVDWLHSEGFPVRSLISESLYIRATDQILLFGITDLTELIWTDLTQSRWGT
jgi:hypothetical protein